MLPFLVPLALSATPGLQLTDGAPSRVRAHLDLDPAADAFTGTVRIDLRLASPTRELWLHARDLSVTDARIVQDGAERSVRHASAKVVDDMIRLRWSGALSGDVAVQVSYSGAVDKEAPVGMFHRESSGEDFLFTQFEPDEARRVFPGFDQPNHKVPWTISVRVPDGDRALSNAPVAWVQDDGDHNIYHFEQTPPLPSYLLAVAAGPFEAVDAGTAGQNGTPIRLMLPPGRADEAGWAVEQTGPVLEWLEAWFGQPYPYAKLDVVTIPDLIGFSAMEHPGLITFTDRLVLSPAETDTVSRRRGYVEVQAHELAHQWFGNLVTPVWWDDLWLNEGFASWMATKATDGLHPSWEVSFDQVSTRERAMSADALASARQIREPIVDAGDMDLAFDSITYSKGQAVLEMFEAWLGPERFQAGVRGYLDAHAHGTATTADFLGALEAEAGQPVQAAFSTFLDQPGAPLISLALDCTSAPHLSLTQQRYLPADRDAAGSWQVPVCVRTPASGGPLCTLMTEQTAELALPDTACPAWVVPNAGAAGYYRSNLGAEQTAALLSGEMLTPEERAALVGDAAALVASGELPPSTVLGQVASLVALDLPAVTRATIGIVRDLDAHLVPADQRAAYARFIRDTYGPLADRLGFDAIEGEPEAEALLRPTVLSLVGRQGEDADLRAEAQQRAPAALGGEGAAPEALGTVLSLAAIDGDVALLASYRAALEATEDSTARQRILSAMTSFTDPAVVDAVIALSLDGDLPLAERGTVIFGLFRNPQTQPMAWERMQSDLDAVERLVPAPFRRYIILLASPLCTPDGRAEAEALLAPRARRWIGGSRTLAQTLERIDVCIDTTAQQQDGVTAFLSSLP